MSTLNERDQKLNDMILQGEILEAFDKFYADDIVMENHVVQFLVTFIQGAHSWEIFGW